MNLRAKVHVENQKKAAEEKLKARLAALKQKGVEAEAIQRDPTVRQIKAQIRKAETRLAIIAAQKKMIEERAKARAEKQAAEKAAKEEAKAEELKGEPEKKEKKAKKEKPAKPAPAEEKKEKREKPKKSEEGKEKPEKAEPSEPKEKKEPEAK